MEICVWGAGYVGLTAAVHFSLSLNHRVVCVEPDANRVAQLQRRVSPFHEHMVEYMIDRAMSQNRLLFTQSIKHQYGKVQVIAVGTPELQDGSTDLAQVHAVVDEILSFIDQDTVIVIKSTVPVGTGDAIEAKVKANLLSRNLEYTVSIVSNPEFLTQGNAVNNMRHPDRIVIGHSDMMGFNAVSEVYQNSSAIHQTGRREAEMIKYVANGMLATRISYMNECARLAEQLGVNFEDVRYGVGSDSRIGFSHITPGIGYGGSCLPKDVASLLHQAKAVNMPLSILKDVQDINANQHMELCKKIIRRFGDDLVNTNVAIWGVAFKAETDDVRNSKSIEVLKFLLDHGANVAIHDPHAIFTCLNLLDAVLSNEQMKRVSCHATTMEAAQDADALLILTNYDEFQRFDRFDLHKVMRQPCIFDGTNLLSRSMLQDYDFEYFMIGQSNE